MLSVVGNLAADAIVEDASVLLRAWLWLVLLCPGLLVLTVDLCRPPPRARRNSARGIRGEEHAKQSPPLARRCLTILWSVRQEMQLALFAQ